MNPVLVAVIVVAGIATGIILGRVIRKLMTISKEMMETLERGNHDNPDSQRPPNER